MTNNQAQALLQIIHFLAANTFATQHGLVEARYLSLSCGASSVVSFKSQVFKSGISASGGIVHFPVPKSEKFPDVILAGLPEENEADGDREDQQDHDDYGRDGPRAQARVT